MKVNKYSILKIRLDGVPKIPYKDGVGNHRGVCAHATANYGSGENEDTATNERSWEQKTWKDAFVHYFCDYNTVLDVANDDYTSYGCGGGNPYFVNVELCQTKRKDRLKESYDRWVWIMAKVLYQRKLGVIDGVTLVSHKWVSDHYGGTHGDPIEYLKFHGKQWSDVVNDVKLYYNTFEGEDKLLEQLQAQVEELQGRVKSLESQSSMSIPDWAQEAVCAAVNKKIVNDPDNRSFDFYSIITVLHRNGVI